MAMQAYVEQFGPLNKRFFANAVPSLAGEGPFAVGDRIENIAPTTAGVSYWVCTVAGNGATATFKTVSNT